jgi:hypothetical protein
MAALPIIPALGCSLIPGLSTACGAASGISSSILSAGAGDVLGALAAGVAQGASWLLSQIGAVISSTTSIDLSASWFRGHYEVMVALAAVVLVPLFLVSVIQSVYRQSPSSLLRTALVHLPLALLLGAVAVQLVQLALAATDALSALVTSTSSSDLGTTLSTLSTSLAAQAAGTNGSVPVFVTLLSAAFVSFGALALWVELLIRSAAVYVATLFFPLALASLVWPAISQWCRRLVETLSTLVLSKFVIVAVLSLAVGALGASDGSIASELAGGALLMLAAFAPFTLLRLLPMVEAGAAHQLEGLRQRAQRPLTIASRSAVSFALDQAGPAPLPELGVGTGMGLSAGPAGPEPDSANRSPAEKVEPADASVGMWRGLPEEPATGEEEQEPEAGAGRAGPPPLWGGRVPAPDRSPRPPRDHTIGQDDLGPVLRWRPGSPPTTDANGE